MLIEDQTSEWAHSIVPNQRVQERESGSIFSNRKHRATVFEATRVRRSEENPDTIHNQCPYRVTPIRTAPFK